MIKKGFYTLFLLLFITVNILSGIITAQAEENGSTPTNSSEINIMIDGKNVAFDVPPTMVDGRILVPFRAVFEALGGKVEWDNSTNTAVGYKAEQIIKLQIDNLIAKVNERKVVLDVPAQVINDRTLVPLRFVSENLGARVSWDDKTNTAIIQTSSDSSDNAVVNYQKISLATLTEPSQMNTILTTDSSSHTIQNHINEGLLRKGKDGKPIQGIADSWETSKDGLIWTFYLRDSKWSDGTSITAKDFEFAFLEALKPENGAEYAYLFYTFKNGWLYNSGRTTREDVGIKALDDKTLELTLEAPAPYLLNLLTFENFAPIKKEFYDKQGQQYGKDSDKLLYSGPWMICEWKHHENMCLVKNPYYWNSKNISLDEINFEFTKDTNAKINMFTDDQVQIANIANYSVTLMQNMGYDVHDYPDGSTWYMEFNTYDTVLSNSNIRKALSYAINRQDFINGTNKLKSKPALNLTDPVISGEKDSFASEVGPLLLDGDVEEARKLLHNGLKELGLETLPKLTFIADNTNSAIQDAKFLTDTWKTVLGIDVEVETIPFSERLKRMSNRDFQIVLVGWSADFDDPISFLDMFESSNANNHTGYSNKEYDLLLYNVRAESDAKKRMAMLKDSEKMLMNDMPIAPLYHRFMYYISKPNVTGVVRRWNQDIDLYWTVIDNSK